jgi:hypothetical protein
VTELAIRLAGGMVIAAILVGAGYYKGYQSGMEKYHAVKATLEQERAQAKADADQARLNSSRVNADISAAWSAAYDHLRKHPVIRVLPAGGCVPHGNAGAAQGADAAAPVAPTDPQGITAEQCEFYINEAVKDVTDYLWLQSWIRKQREALK